MTKSSNLYNFDFQAPVTTEEGREMANKIGADAYMEVSSLKRDNVRETFEVAAKLAYSKNRRSKRRWYKV
jgi:hypothetical protein